MVKRILLKEICLEAKMSWITENFSLIILGNSLMHLGISFIQIENSRIKLIKSPQINSKKLYQIETVKKI